ncbi:kinesin motor domain protein (macronuclear) [Tetrahymena thermophila SB210]|uniref:Kinesin motor domain protein n=1 Tax=Tetrahymena thermophila (strain SB210) TaxID=312017 RepID=W7X2C4_TETTS|nr:kinesin motor domain protein [Tetrahymena thermophila SB210]EWS71777.1 kinesin motor domain protein [Tetrahymena thermophila SB210]|eukprot:XP_012655664.1 kinesin motor domain protein [Tetrahymena thermophila SB210]
MNLNHQAISQVRQDQLVGEEKVIKKLICNICQFLLQNPLMCNKCMNIWCEKCCQQNLHQRVQRCPNLCEDVEFLKSPPLLDELFKIIKIKCQFYKNKEEPQFICNKILEYNEYSPHYYTCEFGYEKCDIQECSKLIKRKEINEHKKECPNKEQLLRMVKGAHLKTIKQGILLNQITELTERIKKDNDKLSIQLSEKSQKLQQVQSFQLNQCRKCLHLLQKDKQ